MHQETLPGHGPGISGPGPAGEAVLANTRAGQLTCGSHCSQPGRLTIWLEGELDLVTAPTVKELLDEVERDGWPTLVLDLRQLSFIDSAGIHVLMLAKERIGRRGGRMIVRNPSRAVRRTLAAIGADRVLEVAGGADAPPYAA